MYRRATLVCIHGVKYLEKMLFDNMFVIAELLNILNYQVLRILAYLYKHKYYARRICILLCTAVLPVYVKR